MLETGAVLTTIGLGFQVKYDLYQFLTLLKVFSEYVSLAGGVFFTPPWFIPLWGFGIFGKNTPKFRSLYIGLLKLMS